MLHTRTIREAAAWFKSQDSQTCLTETAIRTLVRTGQVPCVRVGKKYLVTLEALEKYLSGGKYGLFTSCCGGGQGVTTIIENLRR